MTNLEFYKEYILKQIYNEQMDSFRKNPKNNFISIIYDLMNESFPDYPKDDMWTKVLNWLCEEHQILDEEEKEYLSAVIRPFRNKVKHIIKWYNHDSALTDKTFIAILLNTESISLPCFESNTMYKGMEPNKEYTLEELGL